jgi:hypothetical protein
MSGPRPDLKKWDADSLERTGALLEGRSVDASFVAVHEDPAEALFRVARSEHATPIEVRQIGSGYLTRALLSDTATTAATCSVAAIAEILAARHACGTAGDRPYGRIA